MRNLSKTFGESSPNREKIRDKVSEIVLLQAQLQKETQIVDLSIPLSIIHLKILLRRER